MYGTGPGSNSRPLDLQSDTYLQSDTLSTALRGPEKIIATKAHAQVEFQIHDHKQSID